MNKSAKHEINNKLQIILSHATKLDKNSCHAVKAAVFDIKYLVDEKPKDKILREVDDLIEMGFGK